MLEKSVKNLAFAGKGGAGASLTKPVDLGDGHRYDIAVTYPDPGLSFLCTTTKDELFVVVSYFIARHYGEDGQIPEGIFHRRIYNAIVALDELCLKGVPWFISSGYCNEIFFADIEFFLPGSTEFLNKIICDEVDIFRDEERGESFYGLVDKVRENSEDWLVNNLDFSPDEMKELLEIFNASVRDKMRSN